MATDFTIADVLAWARTKPADEAYPFISAHGCALGQYAREMRGFSSTEAVCERYRPLVSNDLFDAALGAYYRWPKCTGKTFGELVARLETLLPAEPVSDTWTRADAYLTDIEAVTA
jgi:hypothetical protein